MNKKPDAGPGLDDAIELETEQDDAIIAHAFKYSLIAIATIAAVVAFAILIFNRKSGEAETIVAKHKDLHVRDTSQGIMPTVKFVDVTAAAGIDFRHENGAYGAKLLPETMGAGCAFLDYDQDGDQDLLLVNSNFWPWDERPDRPTVTMALYANDGLGAFTNVTEAVGLDVTFYGMGVAVGDYDNDGDVDIFFSAVGENHLFRNEAGKRFTDVTTESGVAGDSDRWSTSCAFVDYDNDGLLDLFVCNYVKWSREYDESQGFTLEGVGRAYGPPKSFDGTMPYLYHNEGQGKFRDVSKDSGIEILNRDTNVPVAKSMGVAPIDLDRDGWIDLIVSNDTVRNFVFHNQQGKGFLEVGELAGMAFDRQGRARGAMGIDTGYYRNNSTLGVCIGNFANEMSALYVARKNPLQFVDGAISSGFGPPTRTALTFGMFFFDYDLDGRLDILGANGHLEEDINKVIKNQHHAQPPQLFWNSGQRKGSEFVQVPLEHSGDDFVRPLVGRGAAFADIDSDGDLDFVITACGGSPRLLRNDNPTQNNWIRFRLVGEQANRGAIGAWVVIHVGDQVMRRQVMPSRSYLSQCELPVTFGLGKNQKIDKAVIYWPDGKSQPVEKPELEKLHTIEQQPAS